MITKFVEIVCDHCGFKEYHTMSQEDFLQKAHDLDWVVKYNNEKAHVFCDQNCAELFNPNENPVVDIEEYSKQLIRDLETHGMHLEET